MNAARLAQVEQALAEINNNGAAVTFTAVASLTGISRTTLYRDPEIVALVSEHRARAGEARTLSGLTADIAHLRTGIEAIAERIRHHEERLRRLERRATK